MLWIAVAQTSLETVKALIVHSPSLALLNPILPIIVTTDGSEYGLEAVLTHCHEDNVENIVAFASWTLQLKGLLEKEALACVWAAEN